MKYLLFFLLSMFLWAKEVPMSSYNIEISGNKYIETALLHTALDVDTNSLLTFWRDNTPKIKDKLLPTLKDTLESFYVSEGFHDATFEIIKTLDTVKIIIQENNPILVKNIEVKSDFNISHLIVLKEKHIFSASVFIAIKSNVIQALLADGYCSYRLDTKAYVDLVKHTAKLKYVLNKGDICTFGKTTIEGLKSIDADIILSRVRAKEGQRFDPKKVKETYSSIYGLNSFDALQVSVDRKIYNVVPIDIKIEEVESAYHLEAGIGYDTYIGPRVHVSLVKKNFFGNAKETGVRLSWSKREQQAIGHFYKPMLFSLFGYGIDFGTEFGYQNLEFRGFQEEKPFIKAYLEHNEGQIKLRAGIALENISITTVDNLRDNEDIKQAISTGKFLLFYPYMDLVYDTRDEKLNPKYGYYLGLSLEYGLPYKAEAIIYVKTLIEGRLVHTFDVLTLSAVGKAGVVDVSSKALPESKLFFAGGSFSNRAYGFNSIGLIESKTSDSISGASSMLNLSLEANYPVANKVYAAVFTDNTMLTDKSYDFSGEVISSLGLGIRYLTPIGPFKLDIGFNVNDPAQYGISFQIGQSF